MVAKHKQCCVKEISYTFTIATTKGQRRNFTKEFKLKAEHWHFKNGKNINKTANNYQVDRKQIRSWLKAEGTIRVQKRKSRCWRHGKVKYPLLENGLYSQFLENGKRLKRWWFNAKAKQITKEVYPNNNGEFKDFVAGKGFLNEERLMLLKKHLKAGNAQEERLRQHGPSAYAICAWQQHHVRQKRCKRAVASYCSIRS